MLWIIISQLRGLRPWEQVTYGHDHGVGVGAVEGVDGDDAAAVGGLRPGPALILTKREEGKLVVLLCTCTMSHGNQEGFLLTGEGGPLSIFNLRCLYLMNFSSLA